MRSSLLHTFLSGNLVLLRNESMHKPIADRWFGFDRVSSLFPWPQERLKDRDVFFASSTILLSPVAT